MTIDQIIAVLGILVTILTSLWGIEKIFQNQKQKQEQKQKQIQKQQQTQSLNQKIDINLTNPNVKVGSPHPSYTIDIEVLKKSTNILFVDDQKFGMTKTVKSAGWHNVLYKKDINSLEDADIRAAHIIFIDINGVAVKLSSKQGLGLAARIKQTFPEKKVIIYSAETVGDRFDEDLRRVDYCLRKDADPIEYLELISDYAKEIAQTNNK